MQISKSSRDSLRLAVKRLYGLSLTDEEAQRQGIAILRFVALKEIHKRNNGDAKGEKVYGKGK